MPDVPKGDWLDMWEQYGDPAHPDTFFGNIRPDVLRRARAGYYGHMTHIDHQINRFMEVLQEYGEANNTYVCLVSDHGEMMGDHNLFRKGLPYEGSARIPMLLQGPKESNIKHNSCCDQVAELRDIMPTLLDCAGLPIPSTVEGKSLLPLAKGDSSEWREYLHGEHTLFGQSLQWITNGHEKYVWCSGTGREQLFHLEQDPEEVHDLSKQPEYQDRLRHWRTCLIQELLGREEGFTDGKTLIPGQSVQPCLSIALEQKDLSD
jgi:arylsulfatase A-like enzyme